MATTRAASITSPAKLLNTTVTNPALFGELLGLLSDRATLLVQQSGFNTTTIGVTQNGGASIVWGDSFGSGANYKVTGFIETLDGEILISTGQKGSTAVPGTIWRSTGWNRATAKAASWSQVYQSAGNNVFYDGRWGFNERSVFRDSAHAGWIIVNEYGLKVSESLTAGGTADQAAIRVLLSKDHGRTWTTVFKLTDLYPGLNAQLHLHASAVDPWFQRVMLTYGDAGFSDGGECGIMYCNFEDLEAGAPVWGYVTGYPEQNPRFSQVTTIVPTQSHIETVSDGEVGAIRAIDRTGYRTYSHAAALGSLKAGIIGANAYTNPADPKAHRLLTYQLQGSNMNHRPAIFRTRSGYLEEVYRHSAAQTAGRGIVNAVGPDVNGKVYANLQVDGTTRLLAGDYTN